MKRVVASYAKLPKEVRLAFDEVNSMSDLQSITFPVSGVLTKGLLFDHDDTTYIVKMDADVRRSFEDDPNDDNEDNEDTVDMDDMEPTLDEEE
jgi:hypothetical protein